jgi:hypothetical protein
VVTQDLVTQVTVCVVIPVFRASLTRAERAALERCHSVLQRYPVAMAAPEGLDCTALSARYPALRKEGFPDQYFASAHAYNCLMLADEFYARFAQYEYILLHQLDAFVFEDQLSDWCERGYDYVGAPWIWSIREPTLPYRVYTAALRRICRLIARPRANDSPPDTFFYRQLAYAAGNGGFSLRRVASMRRALARLPERADLYRNAKPSVRAERATGRWGEDVFFSVEANRYRGCVRVPRFKTAATFAWETSPTIAARVAGIALPFGCHGWDKLHTGDWRPVFARLGYDLDELLRDREALPP